MNPSSRVGSLAQAEFYEGLALSPDGNRAAVGHDGAVVASKSFWERAPLHHLLALTFQSRTLPPCRLIPIALCP